jgi:hypothetical protein
MGFVLGSVLFASLVLVVVVVARNWQPPQPLRLAVPQHPEWQPLDDPAPIAPQLLLVPHPPSHPVRCYEARVHSSGQRATFGVFETPNGEAAGLWIAERRVRDPVEVPDANTQLVTTDALQGMARTGWVQALYPDGTTQLKYANINWYFYEGKTKRVHFVATFFPIDEGQEASHRVSGLLRQAVFAPDDGLAIAAAAL